MRRSLFFDFDGTLIDSKHRQYNLFCELIPQNTLSFNEYWQLKCDNINQTKLLESFFHYSDSQIRAFKKAWMAEIEDPVRLRSDVPFEGVAQLLEKACQESDLFLVTGRQNLYALIVQMKDTGLFSYFSNVFNTGQKCSKTDLVRARLGKNYINAKNIFIGDSGEDIQTGKELGMRTIAVTSGALSNQSLEKYHPDLILESVVQLHPYIG